MKPWAENNFSVLSFLTHNMGMTPVWQGYCEDERQHMFIAWCEEGGGKQASLIITFQSLSPHPSNSLICLPTLSHQS